MFSPLSALILACGSTVTPSPAATPQAPVAPTADARDHVHTEHGVERPDPYYWLRDREDPDVIAYLEAENAYTALMTADSELLKTALYDEMLARIQEDDAGVPWPDGDHQYYWRTAEGQSYPILCRRLAEPADSPEQVLLDENQRAEGLEYYALGAWDVSPDARLLAVAEDTAGREIYTVRVLDLETGTWLPDTLSETSPSLVWANDSATLFYTTMDDALRPHQLWRHGLGAAQADDTSVYVESDERFWMDLGSTRSGEFLVAGLASSITTEVLILDADEPTSAWRPVVPRQQGMEYDIAHHGGSFYIHTNDCPDETGAQSDCALNFKVMKAPVDATDRSAWEELIAPRTDVMVEAVDAFASHLVITERDHGVLGLRARDLESGTDRHVSLPETSHELWTESNEVFDTDTFRFGYSSMVTPSSVFDWDVNQDAPTLLKEEPVLGDYDRTTYTSARLWATADDGTQVPVTVVHRSDVPLDGTAALIMTGYGSYGVPYDPYFTVTRLPLLDRGVVFAIAHIRGGGDMGRAWYQDGKFLNKTHTFTDFIAVTEHLVAQGYAAPDRVGVYGGSAGGMLMGGLANMRPELYAGIVAQVPFVDVVTTMMDETIPLTVIEWEEWGDPHDKTFFDAMLAYSPYDNVTAQDYPPMLITAGLNDPRVQYWEPAKWTARLRATRTDANPLLLSTNMGAGHGGASGLYGYLEDRAALWAFLLGTVGISE